MSAIIINTDAKSSRLLADLARRLGAQVTELDRDQLEDLNLGNRMESVKTGENVPRERIMKLLSGDR
jgi:hypothetical protein